MCKIMNIVRIGTFLFKKLLQSIPFPMHITSTITTGKTISTMWSKYTVDLIMNTAKCLLCTDTRQSLHNSHIDGRDCLPCIFLQQLRQSVCRGFFYKYTPLPNFIVENDPRRKILPFLAWRERLKATRGYFRHRHWRKEEPAT
jgi:hypothetical protein